MIKNTTFTLKGLSIWLICAVFFLYEFFLRTVIGTFQHPIMSDLQLTAFKFSILSSTVYLFIYAVMQIPVGIIVDRFGLKKALLLGALVCSMSAIGFAYSYGYPTAIFFRVLTGFGSSFGFICLLVAVYDWLPARHIALLIGVSQLIGTMGPMLAAGPLEALAGASQVDWRTVFIVFGVIGFGLSVFIALFVKNNQEKAGKYIILKRTRGVKATFKSFFIRAQPWYIGSFAALIYFALEYLSENEGKSFLVLKGFTPTFSAYMITLAWLGYAMGAPFTGWVSDYFQRRRPILIFSAFICSFAIIGIVFGTHKYLIILSFFSLGLGASGQSASYALMAEQFKKAYLAAGLSLGNAMVTLVASVNAPFLGKIIDFSRGDSVQAQLSDYHLAFTILVVIVCCSVIFPLFLIKETYCKSAVDFTYLNK